MKLMELNEYKFGKERKLMESARKGKVMRCSSSKRYGSLN